MKPIAIIPARGGSKRLPRKNILSVLGNPMLFYPVRAALRSNIFEKVIVSTEDKEIKHIATKCGAQVFDRPEKLAIGRSNVVQVCLDVLEQLKTQEIQTASFCCIYATAIFITPEDIAASFDMLNNDSDPDVIMGVSHFNLQPVQALVSRSNGWLSHKWPEFNGLQSQFHPKMTASNGTLYWVRTKSFYENKTFYPKKLSGYEIPWLKAIDIDTREDYECALKIAPIFLNSKTVRD